MMLPDWARQFARDQPDADGRLPPVQVHNLSTTIDLCDVRDVVRAYRQLAIHGRPNEIYNVGSGVAVQTGTVFEILRKIAGQDREIVELHPGIKHDAVADNSRLAACTHWRPQINLAQTVADTLCFWRQHKVDLGEGA